MKLRFLGTAAAEGWPALFCNCDGCRKARELGGKNIRHRCAYLIDDDTLIDFGPDTYAQSVAYGIDLAQVTQMFISHNHSDHFCAKELNWRSHGFSKVCNEMDLYANQNALDVLPQVLFKPLDQLQPWYLTPHLIQPGDTVEAKNLTVTAIKADHTGGEQIPMNYIIQRNGVTFFIGTDSGWWCDESWDILSRFQLDLAVIECTFGITWPDQKNRHLGANITVAVKDEMAKRGILKPDATVITSHFSHNCQNLHQELEDFFNPKGIQVAYDGMLVEKVRQ